MTIKQEHVQALHTVVENFRDLLTQCYATHGEELGSEGPVLTEAREALAAIEAHLNPRVGMLNPDPFAPVAEQFI
jgi:hypothetical protein